MTRKKTATKPPPKSGVKARISELTNEQKAQADAVLGARREIARLDALVKQAREQMIARAARIDELTRLEADSG